MGGRTERELLDEVEDCRWIGLRAPGSGARQGINTGDLWFVWEVKDVDVPTQLVVVEEKYKGSIPYIYEDGEKADALVDFAEKVGAIPLLAGRWSTNLDGDHEATHYVKDIRSLARNENRNISVSAQEAVEDFEKCKPYFRNFPD